MRFKIRTKLIIAFFSIIFSFIVIGGILVLHSAYAVHDSVHKIKSIAEERAVIANLIFHIERALMPGNDYIVTGEKKYIDDFYKVSDALEKIMKEAELIVSNAKAKKAVGDSRIAFQKIKEITQKIFEIPNPVGDREAAGLMEEMDYKWAYPTMERLKERWEMYMEEYREAADTADRVRVHSWIIMIAGAFLLTTIGIFFALFYSRIFVLPIKQVHNGADAIAKGDFKVRLDIKTGDEIEQLSKSMNEMAKQLDTLYHNMGAKIEEGIKKFSAITESANDAIVVLTSPDVIHFWNKKAEEMFGYKIDEVLGKSVHDLVVPQKFREKAKDGLNNFFKTGQGTIVGKVLEDIGLRKDGTEFPIEHSVSAVKIGDEWQAIGIIRDVTEKKKAEEELKREKEKVEKYLDIAYVIIVAVDSKGMVTLINKKGCEMLGYQAVDVMGKDWFDNFIPQKEKDTVRNIFDLLMAGKLEMGRYFENHVVNKSGEEKLISWHNTILTNDRGRITGTLSSGEDITEIKKAEAELNQRIAELEQFRKVTIQRELRMEELKRKNKELEEELKIMKGMR